MSADDRLLREVLANEPPLAAGLAMIYALGEPETREIRYVGQTLFPRRRRWLHRSLTNNLSDRAVCTWVRKLLARGERPVMLVLEITRAADEAEARWIADYRAQGVVLLNMNDGGLDTSQWRYPTRRAVRKGSQKTPLHHLMTQLAMAERVFRTCGDASRAERARIRYEMVQFELRAMQSRLGKHAARDRINTVLAMRYPKRFGGYDAAG